MYITKALINTSTHAAHVTVDESGLITVFKYNNNSCDMEQFINQFDASDYIITPLPTSYYRVVLEGESEE